jgi:hypothetical protein
MPICWARLLACNGEAIRRIELRLALSCSHSVRARNEFIRGDPEPCINEEDAVILWDDHIILLS